MNSKEQYITLLKELISKPSFSGEEEQTAAIIQEFIKQQGIPTQRHLNNVWATNKHFDPQKPTVLLNSHHDTVKPAESYTRDPFEASTEDGRLYGLGSNDAGGALAGLIASFVHFYGQRNLNYNLVLAATAEEEISGENSLCSILDELPKLSCAIVGEPTQLRMAIAEKGLMVLDCKANGKSGHAARDEGKNAIYTAMEDLKWFNSYRFDKVSDLLGPIKMTTTVINAGSAHNVVPDACSFTVDVRTTDAYSNQEVLAIISRHTNSEIKARSTRLNSSGIDVDHVLVQAGRKLGLETYGSPTLSDQALLPVPSIKLGPGKSARSHTADEYIYLHEIADGITTYVNLLKQLL